MNRDIRTLSGGNIPTYQITFLAVKSDVKCTVLFTIGENIWKGNQKKFFSPVSKVMIKEVNYTRGERARRVDKFGEL